MFVITCPNCRNEMRVKLARDGARVTCAKCSNVFRLGPDTFRMASKDDSGDDGKVTKTGGAGKSGINAPVAQVVSSADDSKKRKKKRKRASDSALAPPPIIDPIAPSPNKPTSSKTPSQPRKSPKPPPIAKPILDDEDDEKPRTAGARKRAAQRKRKLIHTITALIVMPTILLGGGYGIYWYYSEKVGGIYVFVGEDPTQAGGGNDTVTDPIGGQPPMITEPRGIADQIVGSTNSQPGPRTPQPTPTPVVTPVQPTTPAAPAASSAQSTAKYVTLPSWDGPAANTQPMTVDWFTPRLVRLLKPQVDDSTGSTATFRSKIATDNATVYSNVGVYVQLMDQASAVIGHVRLPVYAVGVDRNHELRIAIPGDMHAGYSSVLAEITPGQAVPNAIPLTASSEGVKLGDLVGGTVSAQCRLHNPSGKSVETIVYALEGIDHRQHVVASWVGSVEAGSQSSQGITFTVDIPLNNTQPSDFILRGYGLPSR